MAKYINDTVLDAAFKVIKSAANVQISVCTSQPTTYAQANNLVTGSPAGYCLGKAAVTGSQMAIAAGSGGGRKLTFSSITSIGVSADGTAQHVAIASTTATTLYLVTTCTSQVLTTGNKVNVPSFKDQINGPT